MLAHRYFPSSFLRLYHLLLPAVRGFVLHVQRKPDLACIEKVRRAYWRAAAATICGNTCRKNDIA
jgi:hypothetical protein